jgi:Cu(I)/Ag(I) efflux system membrane protein CusA/SilA
MSEDYTQLTPEQRSLIGRLLRWCLTNKLVMGLLVLLVVGWGILVAPFDWQVEGIERRPVPTDAIPDIGENQQIVFTEWMGRSPQDVEDQISYPMTVALLGVPGVKTIRSYSMFGFSTIYIIFKEDVDFYWSRGRVLEKLNSLPAGTLPEGVRPALGPDATALGQIYWYTLEGRDPEGNPAGGWDLEELRTIQDWTVRYHLLSADGVAEVASVGGFVGQYQVDVDPDAMRAYGVTLPEVHAAVKASNIDVGAKTIELNRAEYFVRGLGFIKRVEDIEDSVITVREGVPILVKHVATVTLGPALRRGALDKDGAEAVGGVVVARYGDNPLAVIKNTKRKIEEISPGLPAKAVLDYRKASRERIARFAEDHGFTAFDGPEPNQAAWLEYLRSTPKVDLSAATVEQAQRYAADRGFEAFAGEDVNRPAWLAHLRSVPRDEWPAWVALRAEWPDWVNLSQVTIVPFYDRTGLIYETLGTLSDALAQEILITFIVVILMVLHLRSSWLIGSMLPLAVLLCFIAMKTFGVDANIVALSGIAIAIGTIVDMGIVLSENILRHLDDAPPEAPRVEVIHRAASEVGGAVLTAVATTVVSFLPVFTMIGAEGKLFRPLAFTKTFALIASIVIALTVVPPAAHLLFCGRISGRKLRAVLFGPIAAAGGALGVYGVTLGSFLIAASGAALLLFALYSLFKASLPRRLDKAAPWAANLAVVALVGYLLSVYWEPLGPGRGVARNVVFVGGLVVGLLGLFRLFQFVYPWVLRRALAHKAVFLGAVAAILLFGAAAWLGVGAFFGPIPDRFREARLSPQQVQQMPWPQRYKYRMARLQEKPWEDPDDPQEGVSQQPFGVRLRWNLATSWGGLGKEFMPPLDEGSFLYMPTTMTHASIGEAMDILAKQDMAFAAVPEIDSAVGKIGRAETPLDPAPVSMVETVINYKPEYRTDKAGRRVKYRLAGPGEPSVQDEAGTAFAADAGGELIPDGDGRPYRQWRSHIKTPDDIWKEIVRAGEIPGTISAPKLQPIAARIVMLQSGMRAPMGVKIKGPDPKTIEEVGLEIERFLKEVPSVEPSAVIADRIVGKPYLEIVPDRKAVARYGVKMREFQDIVEIAVGGRRITSTVEGRQRFGVRVRYQRELRDQVETMERILVPGKEGTQIPLSEVAQIRYVRGPQVIKSEDTFLVGYVLFDMRPGEAEVDVVEDCQAYLAGKIDAGELVLPPGVSYTFAGSYENQVRSQKTLAVVLPVALFVIFIILYFQFRSVLTTLLVFSGIFVAWAGGFILLWLYSRPWFLDFHVFGADMRELFQVHPINLSVAVWVGFLALFGIATDNGVIQSTYLNQVFRQRRPATRKAIREATVAGALRRVRPCLMTSATTILALIPVLTSVGRGSDVMVPMAIPSFGGMLVVLLSVFVVPVLYCWIAEVKLRWAPGAVAERLAGSAPRPDPSTS